MAGAAPVAGAAGATSGAGAGAVAVAGAGAGASDFLQPKITAIERTITPQSANVKSLRINCSPPFYIFKV